MHLTQQQNFSFYIFEDRRYPYQINNLNPLPAAAKGHKEVAIDNSAYVIVMSICYWNQICRKGPNPKKILCNEFMHHELY